MSILMPPCDDLLPAHLLKELGHIDQIADAAIWAPLRVSYRGGCHHADAARHLMAMVYHGFSDALSDLNSGIKMGFDKMATGKPKSIILHFDGRVRQVRYKLKTEHAAIGDRELVLLRQPQVVRDLVSAVASELKRALVRA